MQDFWSRLTASRRRRRGIDRLLQLGIVVLGGEILGGLHERSIVGIIEDGFFPRCFRGLERAPALLGLREILPVTAVAQIEAIGATGERERFGQVAVEFDLEEEFR